MSGVPFDVLTRLREAGIGRQQALKVACPKCGAVPERACWGSTRGKVRRAVHIERLLEAERRR